MQGASPDRDRDRGQGTRSLSPRGVREFGTVSFITTSIDPTSRPAVAAHSVDTCHLFELRIENVWKRIIVTAGKCKVLIYCV